MKILSFLLALIVIPSCSLAADINAAASRTSGVAPLSVFFNADLDNSTPTARSFHNYLYTWNFGDVGSGSWGPSGKSKNVDYGPVASHVFETPGTYSVSLVVSSGASIVDSKTFTITVTDPNTVFSGTNTTCLSTTSDFTGCPSGATQITTSNLNTALASYAGAGKRVLLRRGGAWTLTSQANIPDNNGPSHIGAFGTCSTPDSLGVCINAPQVTISTGTYTFDLEDHFDFRLTDITFIPGTGGTVTGGYMGMRQFLGMRLQANNFSAGPFGWVHWRNNDDDYHDQMSLVSNRANTYGSYQGLDSERVAIMGNDFRDCSESHVLRVQGAYMGVISHNRLSGASLANTNGRHALKLHSASPIGGPAGIGNVAYQGTIAAITAVHGSHAGSYGFRNYTKFVVIRNNLVGTSGPWPLSVGPQDAGLDERVSDVLIEGNRVIADAGNITQSGDPTVQEAIEFSGRYITARNNITDGRAGRSQYTGIMAFQRGVEWAPLGIRIYNNTIFSPDSHANGAYGVYIGSTVTDVETRNNLVIFPNSSSRTLISDQSGNNTGSNNYLGTNAEYLSSPTSSTPENRTYALTASATAAIDQGSASVPVFTDFADNSRVGLAYDIGAYFDGSGTPPTCDAQSLGFCLTEGECTGAGGNWCDGACQADACDASCDAQHLQLCGTQGTCEEVGGNWCGGACQIDACPAVTRQVRWGTGTVGWGTGSTGQ